MIAIAVGALALGFPRGPYRPQAHDRPRPRALRGQLPPVCVRPRFGFFVVLLAAGGIGVGVFKTGALALVGDIARSTREHTTMNTVEGFFAVGAMVGPAIVARLLAAGLSWKYLYVIAALICVVLMVAAALARYPSTALRGAGRRLVRRHAAQDGDAYALGFSR